MQFCVVVAPSCEQGANLRFGGLVFVTALYVRLHLSSEMACRIAFRTDSVNKMVQRRAKVPRTLHAVHARIVLDRLDHAGKRSDAGNLVPSIHSAKHRKHPSALRVAPPVETP